MMSTLNHNMLILVVGQQFIFNKFA